MKPPAFLLFLLASVCAATGTFAQFFGGSADGHDRQPLFDARLDGWSVAPTCVLGGAGDGHAQWSLHNIPLCLSDAPLDLVFRGSTGDGHAAVKLSNVWLETLDAPSPLACLGGAGDGHGFVSLFNVCVEGTVGVPETILLGGNGDGYGRGQTANIPMGVPLTETAFLGGVGDGQGASTCFNLPVTVCGTTPESSILFVGGHGDGFDHGQTANIPMGAPLPQTVFLGGIGDGGAERMLHNCSINGALGVADAFLGGLGDGHAAIGLHNLPIHPHAAPIIVTQPLSHTAEEGSSVSFLVHATGVGTLTYQWTKHSRPIDGADDATLVIGLVGYGDAGSYAVGVANGGGTTRSRTVSLVVSAPADSDGDGLPDWWENLHSGGPTIAAPDAPAASGSHSLLEAYIADLDPADPGAVFPPVAVSSVASDHLTLVVDPTSQNRVYGVLRTDDVTKPQPDWTLLPLERTGTGGAVEFPLSTDAPTGFFRSTVRRP